MGVFGWREIRDNVTLKGQVVEHSRSGDGDWILKIRPNSEFVHLLKNLSGKINEDNLVECEVEPWDNLDSDFWERYYFKDYLNKQVTVTGTWVEDKSHDDKTEIHPITSIVFEEDFHDTKFVEIMVFSDDSANFPASVPHTCENRIFNFAIPFQTKPVVPHHDHVGRHTIRGQVNYTNSTSFSITNDAGGNSFFTGTIESGVPSNSRGFYFGRFMLFYESIPRFIPVNVIPLGHDLRITSKELSYYRSTRGANHSKYISILGGKENGVHWKLSKDMVISLMRSNQKHFFVQDEDNNKVGLHIVEPHRTKNDDFFFPYLMTNPDESKANNLLSLPNCPIYIDE
jgi:Protein of unknown function (DUF3892)